MAAVTLNRTIKSCMSNLTFFFKGFAETQHIF